MPAIRVVEHTIMWRMSGKTGRPAVGRGGPTLDYCIKLGGTWPLNTLPPWPPTWWISGGLALAVHFDRTWRLHADVDLAIRALPETFAVLVDPPENAPSWATELVAGWRELEAPEPVPLRLPSPTGPTLDIRVVQIPGDYWRPVGRLQPTVPWGEAVLRSDAGVSYLAPELVLLLKSSTLRASDSQDARNALTLLGPARRARLEEWLPRGHRWLSLTETKQER